jgi:antitoxin (DNA-binding transcriptional repressor) of toxin-antitoxin stability system
MYAIVVDDSTLQFATSLANALAGTEVNITSDGTGVHTITPAALSGSFKLQASNDYNPKINPVAAGTWSDITGSTVAAAGSGSFGWNVSDVYYAWVRLVWTFADGTGNVSATTCVKD